MSVSVVNGRAKRAGEKEEMELKTRVFGNGVLLAMAPAKGAAIPALYLLSA